MSSAQGPQGTSARAPQWELASRWRCSSEDLNAGERRNPNLWSSRRDLFATESVNPSLQNLQKLPVFSVFLNFDSTVFFFYLDNLNQPTYKLPVW